MMILAIITGIKSIFFFWILEHKVNMISNTTTYREKIQTWLVWRANGAKNVSFGFSGETSFHKYMVNSASKSLYPCLLKITPS